MGEEGVEEDLEDWSDDRGMSWSESWKERFKLGSHSCWGGVEWKRKRREGVDFDRERDRLRLVKEAVRVMSGRIGA